MQAHLLSLNDFNRPKVFEADDAAYMHIIQLLLLEPGKFQTHRNMGVGIRSRYRHNNDTNFISGLASDIQNQIETYLPSLIGVDVSLAIDDHLLIILIDTSTGTYVLTYDGDSETLSAGNYSLDDLLV